MTDANASGGPLPESETTALREAIAAAVLRTPAGLTTAIQGNPLAYLRLVVAARTATEEAGRLLREAVDGARHAGQSWDAIGGSLGVTKQAAQQRFGTPANALEVVGVPAGAPERKMVSPLSAFDEMEVLAVLGRHGWHSVDYGTLYHLVEASAWQWEYRRDLISIGARSARLRHEGWELITSMWFPWAYYKRRLDLPAEPDPALEWKRRSTAWPSVPSDR